MPGQSRLTNAAGAFFAVPKLSRKLRAVAQPLMRWRQFTDRQTDFGKREGATLYFDKILNLDASVSDGAIIAEGEEIPTASFKTVQSSVTAQVSARATNWTEEYEVMSSFDVRSPTRSRLVDHMAKSLDYRAYGQFEVTNIIYTPTGTTASPSATWASSGTAGGAASRDVQVYDLKNIVDAKKKGVYGSATSAPVPFYDGVNYQCVGAVDFCRALKDDPEWEKANYYGDPEKLFTGECGRIYGTRIVEDNHILTTVGGYKGQAIFFGEEPVMEIVVTPEELRSDLPDDFGRVNKMAWYYLGGFKIIWEYNATTEPDNRIVAIQST